MRNKKTDNVTLKFVKMDEETALKEWKSNNPDISDEQARELKTEIFEELNLLKPDERLMIDHLKKFVSWENGKHSIQRYLIYYIKREINFYKQSFLESVKKDVQEKNLKWKPEKQSEEAEKRLSASGGGKLKNRSLREIQMEIHERGPLDVFLDYEVYLPFREDQKHGSMLLLFKLAEIYKRLRANINTVDAGERISIKYSKERIKQLEYCKNMLKWFNYSTIENILNGEKINILKSKHDAITLMELWELNEEGTANNRDKIISDNFTYKGKQLKPHDIQVMRKNWKSDRITKLNNLLQNQPQK
jgi:hypothetical protein